MAEIETLTVDEPLAERIERHNFDRLVMLSDGVFAIAITLLVLDLRPPELGAWNGSVGALVTSMWRPLFAYSAGFVMVGGFWLVHRRLFAKLRRVNAVATLLSLLLLFLISGVPAVAKLMSEHGPTRTMLVYLMMVAAISLTQTALWGYAAFAADLVDASLDRHARLRQAAQVGVPALAFSALVGAGLAGVDVSQPLPLLLTLLPIALLRRWLAWRGAAAARASS